MTFQPELTVLKRWDDGSIRVGDTRVLMELVVSAFNEGRTPEEIVISYPTLKLAEAYNAIAYYLENRDQIDAYWTLAFFDFLSGRVAACCDPTLD